MSTALKKITTRAKQLQKQKPSAKWINLVKQAGAEYRAGKLGAVKKKTFKQSGKSNLKNDRERKAKPPGIRRSKRTGKLYKEVRKNRSDKPGSLTGFTSQVKSKLADACLRYELADTVKATKKAQADKVRYRKILNALKK